MDWISPKDKLPPQGKKILYFKKGDIYVVQRIGKYWLPIPFFDSEYSFHDEPELWCDITPPGRFTGFLKIIMNDHAYNVDEFEIHHPDAYKEFIRFSIMQWEIKDDR